MTGAGGRIAALARHIRSAHPIDAIWSSERLRVYDEIELPGAGDHSVASCSFQVGFHKGPEAWRFTSVRKHPAHCCSDTPSGNTPSWHLTAAELFSFRKLDDKWTAWCKHVEGWLVQASLLSESAGERKLGSLPTLRKSTHAAGEAQSHEERCLRRVIRRLGEAQDSSLERPG